MPGGKLVDSGFNRAISALTYGFNCLIWQSRTKQLYECILSIHEDYINILHLIIAKKVSYLLKLHEIYNITDSEFSTQTNLREFGIYHYVILYTQALDSFTFACRTEFEKQELKIALVLFVREAKLYFERLNQFDPFKAEAMMTFLHADKDGGNLLDINEIENILREMKIVKARNEIEGDINEIDRYLYQREKMKRPKNMTNAELNQLGFQYLLRFYSIKDDLARYFNNYCPMFKLKTRSQKNLIVDIVRYNENPIMSASQLCEFYQKVLVENSNESDCLKLIKSFPVYDEEGREKAQENDMISFNNFCSLLSSRRNSAYQEDRKDLNPKLSLPLSDYYIYSDLSNYALRKGAASRINFYELSLKRGCRCLRVALEGGKQGEVSVRLDASYRTSAEEVLKIISTKAFEFNNFPLILEVDHSSLNKAHLDRFAKIATDIFQDQLFTLHPNFQENDTLPSPNDLMKKVLIMSSVNLKLLKAKQKDFPDQSFAFFRIVSLMATRLDFERKGQFCWNYVPMEEDRLRKFEEVEDEHFSNYTRKIMLRVGPSPGKGGEANPSALLAMRLGVQIIGLNFNNLSQDNYIIQSLFLQGGGAQCGYVPKPTWMCLRNPKTLYSKNFDSSLFKLMVKAVSAQNCIINTPPPEATGNYYLEIFLRGSRKEEEDNKRFSSKPESSGYYTKFSLEAEFNVYCLDLAMLVLLVRAEKSNEIMAGRAIPVRHLKQGLRPVFLMGDHFKEVTSSYIFIHSERKENPRKVNSYFDKA